MAAALRRVGQEGFAAALRNGASGAFSGPASRCVAHPASPACSYSSLPPPESPAGEHGATPFKQTIEGRVFMLEYSGQSQQATLAAIKKTLDSVADGSAPFQKAQSEQTQRLFKDVASLTDGSAPFQKVQSEQMKRLSKDMASLMEGSTPFLKALTDQLKDVSNDTSKLVKWQQRAVGFSACAGLGAAMYFRHLLTV